MRSKCARIAASWAARSAAARSDGKELIPDRRQVPRQRPRRIVRAQLAQVADVADMVAAPVLGHVLVPERPAEPRFRHLDALENRRAVPAAAADVVDLAGPRRLNERMQRADDIDGVNLVAHLLALVA